MSREQTDLTYQIERPCVPSARAIIWCQVRLPDDCVDAVATWFYGAGATRFLDATQRPELPGRVVDVKPPRDLCWLAMQK